MGSWVLNLVGVVIALLVALSDASDTVRLIALSALIAFLYWLWSLGKRPITGGQLTVLIAFGFVASLAIAGIHAAATDQRLLAQLGVGVITWLIVLAALLVAWWVDQERRDHKTCPDCCESVKLEANVCRFCGYRWKASPLRSS